MKISAHRAAMLGYIPPGKKVMTPDGRIAVVVRYIGWEDDIRAICRYANSPIEPAVSFSPKRLKVVQEGQ